MKKKVLIGSLVLVAAVFLIFQVKNANQTKLASLAAENKADKRALSKITLGFKYMAKGDALEKKS